MAQCHLLEQHRKLIRSDLCVCVSLCGYSESWAEMNKSTALLPALLTCTHRVRSAQGPGRDQTDNCLHNHFCIVISLFDLSAQTKCTAAHNALTTSFSGEHNKLTKRDS